MLDKRKTLRLFLRALCVWCMSLVAIAQTQPPTMGTAYPTKPIRFIAPFAEADASGHVSRRPARGKDAQAAGFYAIANTIMQQYPARPVRFIVPFAPGGGNDIIARIISAKLTASWGQQVIVDNRPGAGGNVAGEITAKAAPDGYTVFQFNVANTIAVSLYPRLNYDPVRDFAAVTQLASTPFMLVIHPTVKAKTVQELVALAKAQPGKLNYASSGNGGSTHLVTELFKAMSGTNIVHIPYGGAGPALNDLLAGQVQIMFMVPATAMAHIQTGRLRALGVSSLKRSALAPDVPTVAESGVNGFEGGAWYGVVVPAHTPREIVLKLNTDIRRVLQQPEFRERMSSQGVELVGSSPEEFAQFIKSEVAKWGRVVKASGAKIE